MGFYLLNFILFSFCFFFFFSAGPAGGGFARGFSTGGGAHCADGAGRAAKFSVFFVFFGFPGTQQPRGRPGGGPFSAHWPGNWAPPAAAGPAGPAQLFFPGPFLSASALPAARIAARLALCLGRLCDRRNSLPLITI